MERSAPTSLTRFHGGVLVLDEAVSFALSLGNDSGGTIAHPQCVIDVLQRLATIMPHVIVMDRDMTLNPIGSVRYSRASRRSATSTTSR